MTAPAFSLPATVLVALLALLCAIPVAQGSDSGAPTSIDWFEIPGQNRDCPGGIEAFGDASRATCVTTELSFKRLRKHVEGVLRQRRRKHPVADLFGGWNKSRDGNRVLSLMTREQVVHLVFDGETGSVAAIPPLPCIDPSRGIADARDVDQAPERIESARPEFPERARVERVSGVVVLQSIIRRDGRIGEVCALVETPPGRGFLDAALQAYRRWRYEPALDGGEPREVVVTTSFTWELR